MKNGAADPMQSRPRPCWYRAAPKFLWNSSWKQQSVPRGRSSPVKFIGIYSRMLWATGVKLTYQILQRRSVSSSTPRTRHHVSNPDPCHPARPCGDGVSGFYQVLGNGDIRRPRELRSQGHPEFLEAEWGWNLPSPGKWEPVAGNSAHCPYMTFAFDIHDRLGLLDGELGR